MFSQQCRAYNCVGSTAGPRSKIDAHGRRPTQKWGGGHGQNINRMPIWGIRTVVTKTSIKQIPWSISIKIHTELLLRTLIGTWHTTTLNVHTCTSIGGKIMHFFQKVGDMSPCPPCDRRPCLYISIQYVSRLSSWTVVTKTDHVKLTSRETAGFCLANGNLCTKFYENFTAL